MRPLDPQHEARYQEIVADLGFDAEADREAAWRLHRLLPPGDHFRDVGQELKHRPRAAVVGCGPELERLRAADLPEGVVVACDGATQRLREIGVLPRIVVTDLDGDPGSLAWATGQGTVPVVHAHGDNQEALASLVPDLGPLVAGTYQGPVDPALHPMRTLGGLTDGDRAALLCETFGVKETVLVAFDLDAAPSRYSHRFDPERKARKLVWAGRVLADIAGRGRTRLVRWALADPDDQG